MKQLSSYSAHSNSSRTHALPSSTHSYAPYITMLVVCLTMSINSLWGEARSFDGKTKFYITNIVADGMSDPWATSDSYKMYVCLKKGSGETWMEAQFETGSDKYDKGALYSIKPNGDFDYFILVRNSSATFSGGQQTGNIGFHSDASYNHVAGGYKEGDTGTTWGKITNEVQSVTSDGNGIMYFNLTPALATWWTCGTNGDQNFVYFFNNSGNGEWSTSSIQVSGTINKVTVPKGTWDGVILSRQKSTSDPSFGESKQYNQSQEIWFVESHNYLSNFDGNYVGVWEDYFPDDEVYLDGSMNGWSLISAKPFSTGTATVTLDAHKTYDFKIVVCPDGGGTSATWYGLNNNVWTGPISEPDYSLSSSGANILLCSAGEGDYTFTWDGTNKKLEVAYPTVTSHPTMDYCYVYDYEWVNGVWIYLSGSPTKSGSSSWGTRTYNKTSINGHDYYYFATGDYTDLMVSDASEGNRAYGLTPTLGQYLASDSGWDWNEFNFSVAWNVNGSAWTSGTPATSANFMETVTDLPTAPTKPDCDDLKEFVGWTTSSSYSDEYDAPDDLFDDESPAIIGNTTFYAVFAERKATTTIWSEDWTGGATGTGVPTSLTSGGYAIEGAEISYAWTNGDGTGTGTDSKVNSGSFAGGEAPEVMLGKKGTGGTTGGSLTISGIPKDGASSLTLSYKQNANRLVVTIDGDGYSWTAGSDPSNNTAGTKSYAITCGSAETFSLTFTATTTSAVRLDDIEIAKSGVSHINYATTCAECTASPAFDEDEVAVSAIGCTGATVTATDGLSSLGTGDGCHIRNYGFVWSTSANPTTSSYTGIYNVNENIDEGEEFSYDITGLNVGTRYHVRAYAQNKNGTTYTDDVTFETDGPSSISITTAPTKTKYIAGEKFDPTGMVVTASYPDGSTADVTEYCTLDPSTEDVLSDETYVRATYSEECETDFTADQSINVYTVTITEDANPSYGEYSCTSGTTFSVTPNSEKTFDLTVTNASYRDNYDGSFTLYNPTGDITVTIDYRDAVQVKVYYKVDNITVIEQDVYESATTTLPNASAVATAMANEALEAPEDYPNFWGWSETAFTSQTSEPTIVSGTPTIHATKTYYAVYTNMNKIRIDETVITSGSYPGSEQTIESIDFTYNQIRAQNKAYLQIQANNGVIYNNSELSKIVKIEVGKVAELNSEVTVYEGTKDPNPTSGSISSSSLADCYVYNFSSGKTYFTLKGDASSARYVDYIDVFYSSSTPYYMTTFCDNKVAAPTVTDSKRATAADASTVTLSWDAVSGATGYEVKWGVAGEWEDNSTDLTYSKASLAPGTYTWFVKAKYNDASNCGAFIAKGSTTVNTAFEVVYDANTTDYTGDEPEGGFYEPGETVTLSSNELARSRCLWEGWAPYNGETPIDVTTNTFTMPSANVTVKGQWLVVLDKDALYVTSAKDVLTMSSMTMTITRATVTSGSVTISDAVGNQGGEFEAVITDAAADPTTGINATVKINYRPSKANVTESATMTVEIGDEDYDFTVYGRSVPADFVVAAKVGDTWLSLPAIDAALSTPQGHPILVDDNADPTVASVASSVSVFNYYGKDVMANDYIRLADKTNSKALQSSTGSSADGIRVNNAIGSASGNTYEWQLATDDNVTYTLKNDAAKNSAGCYLGMNSSRKWGMFSTPDTKDLRLLPVTTEATNIEMDVLRWHNKAFTFTTSSTIPSYSSINVNYGGSDYSATMSSTRPNKITISGEIDFASNPGKWLTVQWKNAGGTVIAQGAVVAPVVINSDNTNLEGVTADLGYTDVRIADGAKLTITNKDLPRLQGLYIEGGSTLFVSTTGGGAAIDFKITNLTLQGGWTNISGSRKYDMPRIYIDPKSNLSKSNYPVNFDIAVDKSNYYPIAVPFPVSVSGIDYADPYLAGFSTYGAGGQYIIKTYDGANRAEYGAVDANWTAVASDATLQPGSGYVLTAVPIGEEAVIRFPMSFTNDWTKKGEQDTVIVSKVEQVKNAVSVTHYTGTAATARKSHEGWNILGVPYMSCFDASDASHSEDEAFIKGKLNFITGEYSDETHVYVNVPSHDFAEYIQSTIDDAVLLPGWCFFVQFAETGTLVFDVTGQQTDSDLPIYAPKRKEAENMPTVKTGIVLSSETASDKTTFLISDKYSDEYEIGADLEKMFGNGYTLATYSLNNDTRLAFNAMSTNDAKSVIPVGIRIPADGSYTFSLNERYADADIERIDLIDYETNTVTNLTAEDYTFNATRSQNDERFAINITPRAQTPTDIGDTGIDDTNGVRKILLNETIYIIRDGRVYDATGKRVTTINK